MKMQIISKILTCKKQKQQMVNQKRQTKNTIYKHTSDTVVEVTTAFEITSFIQPRFNTTGYYNEL